MRSWERGSRWVRFTPSSFAPSPSLLLPPRLASLSRAFVFLLSLRPRKYLPVSLSLPFLLTSSLFLYIYIYFSLPPTGSLSVLLSRLSFDTFGRRDRCSLVFVSAPSGASFSLSFCRAKPRPSPDLSPIRLQPFPFSFLLLLLLLLDLFAMPDHVLFSIIAEGGTVLSLSLSRFLSDNG